MGGDILGTLLSVFSPIGGAIFEASEQRKIAKVQKRANQIKQNTAKNQQINDVRKAVRERRIKAAIILNQSSATGTTGSSGELGALSGLSGDLNNARANSEGVSNSTQEINSLNQSIADKQQEASERKAFAGLFKEAGSKFGSLF